MAYTYTVRDIITSAQRDMVNLVGNDSLIVDYANRVSLDLLRLSRWKFLESEPQTFTTTAAANKYYLGADVAPAGTTDSTLALGDLDKIRDDSVINRTEYSTLSKINSQPVESMYTQSGKPLLWLLRSTDVLELYPVPDKAYSIEFVYYKTRIQLTDPSNTLQIPDEYFDIVVAGVNELLAMYLSRDHGEYRTDVAYWASRYQQGKREMIRDKNLFPRADFIRPILP